MSTLLELAAKNIEYKAPYTFADTADVLTKSGNVRQSGKLRNLIRKQHSSRASMSGITIYVLRLGAQFPGYKYLSFSERDNVVSIH